MEEVGKSTSINAVVVNVLCVRLTAETAATEASSKQEGGLDMAMIGRDITDNVCCLKCENVEKAIFCVSSTVSHLRAFSQRQESI